MVMSELDFSDDGSDLDQNKDLIEFIKYLGCDGIFVLRIVTLQVGVIYGTELMASLWTNRFGDHYSMKRSRSLPNLAEEELA